MYILTSLTEAIKNSFNQVSKTLEPVTTPIAKELSETASALGNVGRAVQSGLQIGKSSAFSLINGVQSAWNFLGGVVNNSIGIKKDLLDYDSKGSVESYKAAKERFSSAQQHFETSAKAVVSVRDALVLAWKESVEAVSHAKNAASFGWQALSATPGVSRDLYYLASGIKKDEQLNKKAGKVPTASMIRLTTI